MVGTALTTALVDAGITVTAVPDEAAARALVEAGTDSLAIVVPADLVTGGQITIITLGLDPAGEAAELGVVREAVSTAVAGVTGGHCRWSCARPSTGPRATTRWCRSRRRSSRSSSTSSCTS